MGGSNTKPEGINPPQSRRRSEYQTNAYFQAQNAQHRVHPINSSQPQTSQQRVHPINSSQPQTSQQRVHPINSSQPQTSQQRVDPINSSQPQTSQQRVHPINSSQPQTSQQRVHPINSSQPQTSQQRVDPINSSQPQTSQQRVHPINSSQPQTSQQRVDPINSSQPQTSQLSANPINSSQPQTSQLSANPLNSSQPQTSQLRVDPTSSREFQNSQFRVDSISSSELSQINSPSREEPMNNCNHFVEEKKLCRNCNKLHSSLDACVDRYCTEPLDDRWVYMRKPEIQQNYISCPLGHIQACPWKGENRSELQNHLSIAHPNNIKFKLQTENVQRNVLRRDCDVQVLLYENQAFLFHLSINHLWACMTIQLIGPELIANEWVYRITLFVKKYRSKKILFAERCSTNEEAVENVFASGRGLIIPIKVFTNYVVSGDLTFSISLHKFVKPAKKDLTKTN